MGTFAPSRTGTTRTRTTFAAVLVINLVIMLFPPVHLLMAGGSMTLALVYFLGSPVVLIVSMFLLAAIDPNRHLQEDRP